MTLHPDPVPSDTTNLQPDGTVFPPVTPDPPEPPGYVSPLDGTPFLDRLDTPEPVGPGRKTDQE
jgi:hypothetical protein